MNSSSKIMIDNLEIKPTETNQLSIIYLFIKYNNMS